MDLHLVAAVSQPEYLARQRCEAERIGPWTRRIFFWLVVAALVLAAADHGNATYSAAYDTWTEQKIARVERARAEPRIRIWSKKCERQGRAVIATRADNGPWHVRCGPKRLTVPKGTGT